MSAAIKDSPHGGTAASRDRSVHMTPDVLSAAYFPRIPLWDTASSIRTTAPIMQAEAGTERIRHWTVASLFPWHGLIRSATDWREIAAVIGQVGMGKMADRILYLCELADGDPDEAPINLESLRKFALFIISRQHLPRPRTSVNPDGLVQAVWSTGDGGILAMNFLPTGDVRFAAIPGPREPKDLHGLNGVLQPDLVMEAIQPLVAGLTRG